MLMMREQGAYNNEEVPFRWMNSCKTTKSSVLVT
jgi:hypothetical protein